MRIVGKKKLDNKMRRKKNTWPELLEPQMLLRRLLRGDCVQWSQSGKTKEEKKERRKKKKKNKKEKMVGEGREC